MNLCQLRTVACFVLVNEENEELHGFLNELQNVLNNCQTEKWITLIGDMMVSWVCVKRDERERDRETIWRSTCK